jgi:hypothetical protein
MLVPINEDGFIGPNPPARVGHDNNKESAPGSLPQSRVPPSRQENGANSQFL